MIPAAMGNASAAAGFSTAAAPPSIVAAHDSDSDPDVQSLTIPFRAGSSSSENFLPMVSTDDTWISELEFRWVFLWYYLIHFSCFLISKIRDELM